MLAGNVFCGHCGSRLALTTNGKAYPCKEDAHRIVKRVRYICYGKTRKQTECDGQTSYTAHILDGVIDKVVRQIFERMKAIPKSEIVNIRYREKMEERKALLNSVKSDYTKAAAELDTLRAEVIKSLRGESAFSQDLLSSLIPDCETKCLEVQRWAGHFGNRRIRKARFKREVGIKQKTRFFQSKSLLRILSAPVWWR